SLRRAWRKVGRLEAIPVLTVSTHLDEVTDPALALCVCGPLATRRKRTAVACACVGRILSFSSDRRLKELMEVGRRYANKLAEVSEFESAVRAADKVEAEARKRVSATVWSIFEGRRTGSAQADALVAQTVTRAIRWALGLPGGLLPPVPSLWFGAWTA